MNMYAYYRMDSDFDQGFWLLSGFPPEEEVRARVVAGYNRRLPEEYRLRFRVLSLGNETDLALTPLQSLIASVELAEVITSYCSGDVQCLPILGDGLDRYRFIHPWRRYACEEERLTKQAEGDILRGSREAVAPILRASLIGASPLFWVGNSSVLVVRSDLKEVLETAGTDGVRFQELPVVR